MEYYCLTEDQLRQKLFEISPELRAEHREMCELLRESVRTEREKLGLDNPRGVIELYPNKDKKHTDQPDFNGRAWVSGRSYAAAAWVSRTKIKITLQPPKAK